MPTFSTPGPINANVEVAGARVRINAGNRSDTVVAVEPMDPASPQAVRAVEKTTVEFSLGELTVKMRKAGGKGGSVAVTIDLPAGSDLVYSGAHSSLQADGPLGGIEVNLASGRVRLDRVAELRASLAAGELAVSHIAGPAHIQGGSAAVKIGEVRGAVKLLGSSGHVWIGDAAADLDLINSNGGFDIGRAGGNVIAMAGGRAVIRIGSMTRGHAELINASGNIEVGIGEGTAVRLEADSKFGSVRNSVSSRDQAEVLDRVTVHARTRRGDIKIHRAAS